MNPIVHWLDKQILMVLHSARGRRLRFDAVRAVLEDRYDRPCGPGRLAAVLRAMQRRRLVEVDEGDRCRITGPGARLAEKMLADGSGPCYLGGAEALVLTLLGGRGLFHDSRVFSLMREKFPEVSKPEIESALATLATCGLARKVCGPSPTRTCLYVVTNSGRLALLRNLESVEGDVPDPISTEPIAKFDN